MFLDPHKGLDSTESAYTSLIQQYLSLFLHDNAIFLAERMVAHRPSLQSIYLLGVCYYRSGRPKCTRSVLLQKTNHIYGTGSNLQPSANTSTVDGTSRNATRLKPSGKANQEELEEFNEDEKREKDSEPDAQQDELLRDSISYLLAKCCFDLSLYSEAEDHLLRPCRNKFTALKRQTSHPQHSLKTKQSVQPSQDMDEWIVQNLPCPVPNGAAGLNLLGNICLKRNRHKRAEQYFRMSLKLDPLLWTSYEALCEMGVASSDKYDPAIIFGAVSPTLLSIPISRGGSREDTSSAVGMSEGIDGEVQMSEPNNSTESISPVDSYSISHPMSASLAPSKRSGLQTTRKFNSGSFAEEAFHGTVSYSTPATPFRIHQPTGILRPHSMYADEEDYTGDAAQPNTVTAKSKAIGNAGYREQTNLTATALFNTGGRYISSANPRRLSSDTGRKSLSGQPPSQNLFNTPGLTPIQRMSHDLSQDMTHINRSMNVSVDFMQSGTKNIPGSGLTSPSRVDTITRAKEVAARLYYKPSPETTPPHAITLVPHSSLKLARGTRVQSKLDLPDDKCDPLTLNTDRGSRTVHWDESVGGQQGIPSVAPPSVKSVTTARRDIVKNQCASDQNGKKVFVESDLDTVGSPTNYFRANVKKISSDFPDDQKTMLSDECMSGVQNILELLGVLGAAQRQLTQYKCQDALHIFFSLPHSQFNTGWVLHQVGRAYFELADYHNAQRALESMQRADPHRMKGLELLSTTFWHLKKEVELSNLAQRAVEFDRMSPEAWCVVGNCFSLQKEHDTALTFFRRSIQLDQQFTYSHTLSGHEYVSNEDFEKAISCFRNAIRANDRHYNAWYGLGAIYFRQEKYDLAEKHFEKALGINPNSSVLHCHLGMARYASGKPLEALETLSNAFRLDPRNPQARYQRATIYMTLGRPQEALEELEKVRDAAPKEASVYFALGKVLKRLGHPEKAMRAFLTALDLDPKDNKTICAAMERLNEPDMDEDISAF